MPVLERLPARGRLLGSTARSCWVDLDGFVALLALEPPFLPNALQVDRLPENDVELEADGARAWDPRLHLSGCPELRRRGHAILEELGVIPLELDAAERLLGRGPGLTPEGDDLLAGAVAVLAALARPHALLDALAAADLRVRTTALSATLLELALRGCGPEPLHRLFGPDDWRGALAELSQLGHTTGRAYAIGAATAAALPE
jgi:hypothetical protein